jgi:hypothetical protein
LRRGIVAGVPEPQDLASQTQARTSRSSGQRFPESTLFSYRSRVPRRQQHAISHLIGPRKKATIEISTQAAPHNRRAVISIVAAVLALLCFCGGIAPIPLTGFVCFPAAALLGLTAAVLGLSALRQIRSSAQSGRGLALTGVAVGSVGALGGLCMATAGIVLLSRIMDFVSQLSH